MGFCTDDMYIHEIIYRSYLKRMGIEVVPGVYNRATGMLHVGITGHLTVGAMRHMLAEYRHW
jgi:hypothetical protein